MLEPSACALCRSTDHLLLLAACDPLKRIPGTFHVVKCRRCGFAYLNPTVSQLLQRAPHGYGPSLTRSPQRSAFHGGRLLRSATRRALVHYLGYQHLDHGVPDRLVRSLAWLRSRRLAVTFPPFLGRGRLLDIGCWTGGFLERMREVGWDVTGIELLPEAAALARAVTGTIFVGDLMDAPFPDRSFDVVTVFHVVEHVPEPVTAIRRILRWLAPGGMALIEVPNFAGLGRRLFGSAWHGLDLPFHLWHFTPRTLARAVEQAGGEVIQVKYLSDWQYVTKSLEIAGTNVSRRVLRVPLAKRLVTLSLALACQAGFGEAIRLTARPAKALP
ncbi:MAG: class I SAM-dependent methyltransferase [Candidatus Methylomirabilia bacterium]